MQQRRREHWATRQPQNRRFTRVGRGSTQRSWGPRSEADILHPSRPPPRLPVLVHWMVGFSRPVAEQDTVTSLSNSMHCSGWGGGVNFSFSAKDRGAVKAP